MSQARDQNDRPLTRSVHREGDLWYATVWFGHCPATNVRDYGYRTRDEARRADISDTPTVARDH